MCFPVNIAKLLRTANLKNISERLVLNKIMRMVRPLSAGCAFKNKIQPFPDYLLLKFSKKTNWKF